MIKRKGVVNNNAQAEKIRPNNLKSLGTIFSVVSGKCSQNVLSLVSSLCKICDNDVVVINLRCSRQVCKCPIWTSPNFEEFATKNSFLPLIWCLQSLFCCMYLFRKQSNKANLKHIEDVHFVYYQFNTCSALYHCFLSRSHAF